MQSQSKGNARAIQATRLSSRKSSRMKSSTERGWRLSSFSPRTARLAMSSSSKTTTSSQRRRDSSPGPTSVSVGVCRSRGDGGEGQELRTADIRIELWEWGGAHSVAERHPVRVVQVDPKVIVALFRISWRRLKVNRNK
jgi:hypothetical protein